ncbi:hypothetical protein, partial [Nostoc sp.]
PSPRYGRGTLKFWLPFSQIWEKGLGDEGKSFSLLKNYRFQDRRGLTNFFGKSRAVLMVVNSDRPYLCVEKGRIQEYS